VVSCSVTGIRSIQNIVQAFLPQSNSVLARYAAGQPAKQTLASKQAGTKKFELEAFFDAVGITRTVKTFRENEVIFVQGDPARGVLFIRKGRVKRTVVSRSGKEGVVGILGPGDLLGEWCLSAQPVCMATATAMEPTTLLMISREEMLRALHTERGLLDELIAYLLARAMRMEEDLIDQLFNSTEKRLARALLRLARYGRHCGCETCVPKVSQQTLAEMIGTTRTHVNYFMNKFKKLGFIDYSSDLRIRNSLLNVILRE
jgi:CRP/FNR family transcriptional regulator, cyclic AMP receptor protein